MNNNSCFALEEWSNSDSCLAMAKVYKSDKAWVLFRQVCLSEEAIIECNSSALVDESETFESCNFSSIEDTLSFNVAEIWWYWDNDVIWCYCWVFKEGLDLPEIVSENLLRCDYLILSTDWHLETNFLVLKWNEFVCNERFFLLKLLLAICVQANKASEELESILEILLLLVHCSVTDESLLISVCNNHGSLFVCSVWQDDINTTLSDGSKNRLERADINTYY